MPEQVALHSATNTGNARAESFRACLAASPSCRCRLPGNQPVAVRPLSASACRNRRAQGQERCRSPFVPIFRPRSKLLRFMWQGAGRGGQGSRSLAANIWLRLAHMVQPSPFVLLDDARARRDCGRRLLYDTRRRCSSLTRPERCSARAGRARLRGRRGGGSLAGANISPMRRDWRLEPGWQGWLSARSGAGGSDFGLGSAVRWPLGGLARVRLAGWLAGPGPKVRTFGTDGAAHFSPVGYDAAFCRICARRSTRANLSGQTSPL